VGAVALSGVTELLPGDVEMQRRIPKHVREYLLGT